MRLREFAGVSVAVAMVGALTLAVFYINKAASELEQEKN